MLNEWILIGLLSVSTYVSRIIGVEIMARRKMGSAFRIYFNYVPVAIISALIIKQILVPTEGHLDISYPVLIGCLSTAITMKIIKIFLPSVVIGIMIGLLARYFLIS
ncbi:branched-subunit amino acid transport protein [Melghirimyces profundicolus]|uniref:Branched-subunit amino acid transport protein n=1 Tax=Melghirimyces profundicolus TaxID=1242148 RepID=A0A2T6BGA4_9BACL|nr:AzlD domain-containing protein [Melghirimyces profundicolus]PTX55098.1 branched-subunit amino acid transport protein [Melghirimyces profundicolus]